MAKKAPATKPAEQQLIAMSKDGEKIKVCADQVDQHQRLGWSLVQ